MHIREFRYLRMPEGGGNLTWESIPEGETIWHIHFPSNSLKFKLVQHKALVILQETVNPDSTITLEFRQGAEVAIVGNTFIYFQMGLAPRKKKENLHEDLG